MKSETKQMVAKQAKIFGVCVFLVGLFVLIVHLLIIGWDNEDEQALIVLLQTVFIGCSFYGVYHWIRFAIKPVVRTNLDWRPVVAKEILLLHGAVGLGVFMLLGGPMCFLSLGLYPARAVWWAVQTLRARPSETAPPAAFPVVAPQAITEDTHTQGDHVHGT